LWPHSPPMTRVSPLRGAGHWRI